MIYLRPPSTSFPSPQMPAWEGGWGGGGAVRIMAWRGKREEKGSVWEGALDELPITPKFLRLPSESTFAFCVVVFVDDFFQNRPSIVSKET
jgi:hypothetical protein